jgi:NAD(P)H-hydrate epimerase
MGAARAGAGYVTLATPTSIHPILAAKLTEATYIPLPEQTPGAVSSAAVPLLRQAAQDYNVLLLGCGLGQQPATAALVRQLLFTAPSVELPLVLDADGLNLLAWIPEWWKVLKTPTVVTPHPGEMARLLGSSVAAVEADRVKAARHAAALWGVAVVLKGAFTVIASPEGPVRLSPFANPALATAGTGDVLAGVVAGLMAQGLSPFEAASAGVFLHGAAGDLVRRELGPAGAVASDLLPALPRARKAIIEGSFTGGVQEEP